MIFFPMKNLGEQRTVRVFWGEVMNTVMNVGEQFSEAQLALSGQWFLLWSLTCQLSYLDFLTMGL